MEGESAESATAIQQQAASEATQTSNEKLKIEGESGESASRQQSASEATQTSSGNQKLKTEGESASEATQTSSGNEKVKTEGESAAEATQTSSGNEKVKTEGESRESASPQQAGSEATQTSSGNEKLKTEGESDESAAEATQASSGNEKVKTEGESAESASQQPTATDANQTSSGKGKVKMEGESAESSRQQQAGSEASSGKEKPKTEGKVREPTHIMIAMNESNVLEHLLLCRRASISSASAFQWIIKKIVRSNGAGFRITFINVQGSNEQGIPDNPKRIKNQTARGVQLMLFYIRRCQHLGIKCRVKIERGDPKTVICSVANTVMPDLLVLGCRGLEPYKKFLLPHVSEYVQRHAKCPVIVIKRRPEETPYDPSAD